MGGCKTEVCKPDRTILAAEDVLRLQITVVDALPMTSLDSVQDLDEVPLNCVIVKEVRIGYDPFVKITTGDEVEDDIDVVVVVECVMECHDVRLLGQRSVESDLPLEIGDFAVPKIILADDLNGSLRASLLVQSLVHSSIGTATKHLAHLVAAGDDTVCEVGDEARFTRHDGVVVWFGKEWQVVSELL